MTERQNTHNVTRGDTMTEKDVYDVLVREAGASDDESNRAQFHHFWKDRYDLREYRFIGTLGFGGKVWFTRYEKAPYVNCYPEHLTDDRMAVIRCTNAALEGLV